MTIMRVTLAGSQLGAQAKEQLARRLIDAFAEVEVGRSSPEIRAGFVVRIDQVDPADLWMGDRPMSEAGASGRAALLDARVMAGPWTRERKAELIARLDEVLREEAQIAKQGAGADVWITLVEVPEGAWGLGGRPVSIGALAPVFDEERQARIRAYLERLEG